MKRVILVLLLIQTSFLFYPLYSQPEADFSVTNSQGCAPLTVQFNDLSVPDEAPIEKYVWSFGDDQKSNDQNPTHTYTEPGDYKVLLVVEDTDGLTGKDYGKEDSVTIHVSAKPNPTFEVEQQLACQTPAEFSFTNTTSSSSGDDIVDYSWAFGDGENSDTVNPTHTYTEYGKYSVSLMATDENGCKDTTTRSDMLEIHELNAQFTAPDTVCRGDTVTLRNTSEGEVFYEWQAGGRKESNVDSISLVYSTKFNENVQDTLTASYFRKGETCQDQAIETYFVEKPYANIIMDTSWACSFPVSVNFSDSSISNARSWSWDFGDGSSSSSKNPSHTYNEEPSGTSTSYDVFLSIETSNECKATTTESFQDVHPDIQLYVDTAGCIPLPVKIADTTKWDSAKYFSKFYPPDNRRIEISYDNNDNVIKNKNFSENDSVVNALVEKPGDFTVKMITNDDVCGKDSVEQETAVEAGDTLAIEIIDDSLKTPMGQQSNLCIAQEYKYKFRVTNQDSTRPDSAVWSLNGGEVDSIKTAVDTSVRDEDIQNDTMGMYKYNMYQPMNSMVKIKKRPGEGGFKKKYGKLDTMIGDSVRLSVTAWHNYCAYDTTTLSFKLNGPLGNIDEISFECNEPLTYTFKGEADTLETGAYHAYWDIDTTDDYEITMNNINDSSQSGRYYTFKDPAYRYDNYEDQHNRIEDTKLRIEDDATGCYHDILYEKFINKANTSNTPIAYSVNDTAEAIFQVDPLNCWDDTLNLRADSTPYADSIFWQINNKSTGNHLYPEDSDWDTVDIVSYNDATFHLNPVFDQRGIIEMRMQVRTKNKCKDAVQQVSRLFKPYVNFKANDRRGCLDTHDVTFDTLYTPVEPDTTYSKWEWTFEKGEETTATTPSSQEHTYEATTSQYYSPSLKITDVLGCTYDSTLQVSEPGYILITKPQVSFATDTSLCEKSQFQFNNTSYALGSDLSYKWNFDGSYNSGMGGADTMPHPLIKYDTIGTYSVKLVAEDTIGCADSVIKPDYLHVHHQPVADFNIPNPEWDCYEAPIQINDSSDAKGDSLVSRYWKFGDGEIGTTEDPFHTYVYPGNYDVQLTVTTNYNCKDTILKENAVEVGGPYAEFSVDTKLFGTDMETCRADTVSFSMDSLLIEMNNDTVLDYYIWHYNVDKQTGDDIGASTDTVYNITDKTEGRYRYQQPNMKYVYLELIGFGGCNKYAPKSMQVRDSYDSVDVVPLSADFVQHDTACGSNAEVKLQSVDSTNWGSWEWSFGDGTTNTSDPSPDHTYDTLGAYRTELWVKGKRHGCIDSVKRNINVYATPEVNIYPKDTLAPAYLPDTVLACDNSFLDLTTRPVSSDFSYQWGSNENIRDAESVTAQAKPADDAYYYLTVTVDSSTCQTVDTTFLKVQDRPNATFYYIDVRGDTIQTQRSIFLPLGDTLDFYTVPDQENVAMRWKNLDTNQQYFIPTKTKEYQLFLEDSLQCYNIPKTLEIEVSDATVDVPTAFTPNGDGINDVIKFNGWGIKRLIKFQIYDRWGQKMFETRDKNKGWDGTYKGEKQPSETYTYKVKVETKRNNIVTKKGTFTLMR